jgi:hypothetical protein
MTAKQPLASQPVAKPDPSLDEYLQRYFDDAHSDQPAGEHTRMIRLAYKKVQRKQKRKYGWIVALLLASVLGAGGYALYLHEQVKKQRAMAQDIFYAMKAMDVNIANVQTLVLNSRNQQGMAEIQRYSAQRQEMEKNYDQFLSNLRVYNAKMTEQERLILRVTRIFGECELAMPADFVAEIQSYIKKWQSTGRLATVPRAERWATRGRSPKSFRSRTCRRSFSIWRCRKATSTRSPAVHQPAWGSPKACGSSFPRPQ